MPEQFDPDKYLAKKREQFDPDAYLNSKREPVEPTAVEGAVDYVRSFSGLPQYVVGSVPFLGPAVQRAGLKAGAALKTVTSGGTGEDYQRRVDEGVKGLDAERAAFESKHPVLALGGGLVGASMVPVPNVKAVSKLPAAAQAIAKPAIGIGSGAALAAADAVARDKNAEDAAISMLLLGGGLTAASSLLGKAFKAAPRTITGVRDQTAQKYLARSKEINAVSEEDLIQDIIRAKDEFLQNPLESAQKQVEIAKESARRAEKLFTERLKSVDVPAELPGMISAGLKDARKIVSAASAQGFDVLEASGKTINTAPLKSHLTSTANKFKIGKTLHPSDVPTVEALIRERQFLDRMGKEMRPEDAKKLIQALDRMEEAAWNQAGQSGGHISAGDRALMGYRKFVDSYLKEIPEYAEAMKKASTVERAIQDVRDLVGKTEPQIATKLKNLNPYQRKAIAEFEGVTGQKYLPQLKQLEDARKLLGSGSKMEEALSSLPQNSNLKNALGDLESAKIWLEPVKNLGDVSGVQSTIRRAQSEIRPDFKSKYGLGYLGEISGKNFIQSSDDLAVQRAFSQGFLRGSRNVNLGSLSLAGLAKGTANLLGSDGLGAGGFGQTIGAVLGAGADLIGPQQYKKLLDASMKPAFRPYLDSFKKAVEGGPRAFAIYWQQLNDDKEAKKILDEKPASPGLKLPTKGLRIPNQ